MISNGLTKIILYLKQNGSYILKSVYDICIGTYCEEIGLNNKETYVDIISFIKNSNKQIEINKDVLSINYEIPRIIDMDLHDLLSDYNFSITEKEMVIITPMIFFIDETFKYEKLNNYVKENSQYGVKEYKI